MFFAFSQVMPCTSPPVTIEQLSVMFEPGSTIIGLLCRHPDDGKQEDLISHSMLAADDTSVK